MIDKTAFHLYPRNIATRSMS